MRIISFFLPHGLDIETDILADLLIVRYIIHTYSFKIPELDIETLPMGYNVKFLRKKLILFVWKQK